MPELIEIATHSIFCLEKPTLENVLLELKQIKEELNLANSRISQLENILTKKDAKLKKIADIINNE